MGMTIDECYKWVRNAKIIMRKYKQIEEILSKRPDEMIQSNPTLNAIRKVIEDGNVD